MIVRCDCDPFSYHRWNCSETPLWAQTMRDLAHPCVDCGEPDPIVLEFDHVRGIKHANLGDMRNAGVSIAKIDAEIAKCEVRCANCHRRVTHARRLADKAAKVDAVPASLV